jgi:hypothetical protein
MLKEKWRPKPFENRSLFVQIGMFLVFECPVLNELFHRRTWINSTEEIIVKYKRGF